MKSDLYRTRVKRFGRKKCVTCPDFEDHYLSFVYSCTFKTPVIKLYTNAWLDQNVRLVVLLFLRMRRPTLAHLLLCNAILVSTFRDVD